MEVLTLTIVKAAKIGLLSQLLEFFETAGVDLR
jgi:hypothetical protein